LAKSTNYEALHYAVFSIPTLDEFEIKCIFSKLAIMQQQNVGMKPKVHVQWQNQCDRSKELQPFVQLILKTGSEALAVWEVSISQRCFSC
jgi:hypothetical protein